MVEINNSKDVGMLYFFNIRVKCKPRSTENDEGNYNNGSKWLMRTLLNLNRREVDKYHCFSCSEPILMVVPKKLIQKINGLCVVTTTIDKMSQRKYELETYSSSPLIKIITDLRGYKMLIISIDKSWPWLTAMPAMQIMGRQVLYNQGWQMNKRKTYSWRDLEKIVHIVMKTLIFRLSVSQFLQLR